MITDNGLKKFQEAAKEVNPDLIVTREDGTTIKDSYLKNPYVETAIKTKGKTQKATREEIKQHHEDEYMAGVL